MGIFRKNDDVSAVCKRIVALSKIGAPTLKVIYYVSMIAAVLAGIIAFIMVFVNVEPSEMMLPPFMKLHGDEYYSLTVGNGIRIDAPYAEVTTADIKTVIYAQLMLFATICIVVAPISLFLSKFMKNVAKLDEYNPENQKNILYIGVSVVAGGILIGLVRSLFNFMLISNFTAEANAVHLSFNVDIGGIILGLMIIMFSYFWGSASEKSMALVKKTEDEE